MSQRGVLLEAWGAITTLTLQQMDSASMVSTP